MRYEINAKEFQNKQAEYLNRVKWEKKRIIICKHNKPYAALIPLEDLKNLELWEGDQPNSDTF